MCTSFRKEGIKVPQKVFLSNTELEEAVKLCLKRLDPLSIKPESIDTWKAAGRISYTPVFSKISSPFYRASAMDGIATLSSKTFGASDRSHIVLCEGVDYIVVDTGDPIPKDYDTVIMVEDLIKLSEGRVAIFKSASPWENIRPIGEDIVEAQLIIPSKHCIRPVDIGAMLAGGVNSVQVYKKPLVGIIPTGTELVEPGAALEEGNIIEFNSRVFSAMVEQWGGEAKRYGIVKDDYNLIKDTVKRAVEECDIVLINAGSSAGREDFTCEIIRELGQAYIHGVAIKPGKPVILGEIYNKPLIGIPGYPVSAYFVMENICKQVVKAFLGLQIVQSETVKAVLSRRIMSSLKYLEFLRVKLGYVGGKLVATPLSRGAGATMSLVRADGVLEIPQNVEGYEAGTTVEVKLLKSKEEIKNTLVCIGSHDPILDIASELLHLSPAAYFLSSANVGSMGGLMALKSGEAHIAPIHLLDMERGQYNVSYIERFLKNKKIALIKGVKRIQGLIVPKGNPMNINCVKDIITSKASFVNRQRGSGTRLFFDYKLKEEGLEQGSIIGFEREEFTHLAVAAAVAAGDADCGIGVYSAAKLMGLDFIPLGCEEYDFAVPEEFLSLEAVKEFINVIKGYDFKGELDKLGGYDYSQTGEIRYIGECYER
jgi:putative molybdopterin biosynthesis protein